MNKYAKSIRTKSESTPPQVLFVSGFDLARRVGRELNKSNYLKKDFIFYILNFNSAIILKNSLYLSLGRLEGR